MSTRSVFIDPERRAELRTRLASVNTGEYTIERYRGDRLIILHTQTGRRITDADTINRLTDWFWQFVAVPGGDPQPEGAD